MINKNLPKMLAGLLVFGGLSLQVFAQDTSISQTYSPLTQTEDFTEIEGLADEIIEFTNEIQSSDENISYNISYDDIAFDEAVKIYVGTNIFSVNNDSEDILNALSDSDYIWEVPIYVNDSTVVANISKGLPLNENAIDALSPEEIQEIQANEGKWHVSAIKTYPYHINYYETLEDQVQNVELDDENTSLIFVGGISNIRTPFAVLMSDDIDYIMFTGKPQLSDSVRSTQAATTLNSIDSNKLVKYDELSDILTEISEADETSDDIVSGLAGQDITSSTNKVWILLALVCSIGVAVVFYSVKKRRTNSL